MSTNVMLHAGHDVAYFTSGQGRGGCAGAMSYYTAAGEPPGQWAGKGAAALGLSGQVDRDTIERLYPGRHQRRPAVAAIPETGSRARGTRCRCTWVRTAACAFSARDTRAQTDSEPEVSELETSGPEAGGPGPADDGRAARLDELQARADEAARRIDAQRAELEASREHTARIQREAQAKPEADRQAETPYEMEMEL